MPNHTEATAYLLWCPDVFDTSGRPFAYAYTSLVAANGAIARIFSDDNDLNSKLYSDSSSLRDHSKNFRERLKDIRIDEIPLLIDNDLRGL